MKEGIFEPGDRVIRTEGSHELVKKGEIYTVKSGNDHTLLLKEITGEYHPPYFQLCKEDELISSIIDNYSIY